MGCPSITSPLELAAAVGWQRASLPPKMQAEFLFSLSIPKSPTPNRRYCPKDVFFIYPPLVRVWFTELSLCSWKLVDITRIATALVSSSSPLPVTFNVILGTELLWYVQYVWRQLPHLYLNTLATVLQLPANVLQMLVTVLQMLASASVEPDPGDIFF